MATIPKEVSEYMRQIGRNGGSVKSPAKAEAARRNGKRRKATQPSKPARKS